MNHSEDMKEKSYSVVSYEPAKYISHPDTGKVRRQRSRFKNGLRYVLGGITPDYDDENLIKEAYTNIFRTSKDMEPDAPEMEIDWMKKQDTIHIVYIYPDKNVHYFLKWWKEEN